MHGGGYLGCSAFASQRFALLSQAAERTRQNLQRELDKARGKSPASKLQADLQHLEETREAERRDAQQEIEALKACRPHHKNAHCCF